MPIAFAPLVGLALGAALAWLAAPELMRLDGPIVACRPFAVVTAFAGLVFLPVVGYFVAFHGDWSYLYLVSWQRVPSAVDLGLVLIAGATVVAGFGLAVGPVRTRRLGPVVALVVGLPVVARRLGVSGTYAQYHGEFGTQPIGASVLGKGVLLMTAVLALGLAWTVRALLRMAAEAKA